MKKANTLTACASEIDTTARPKSATSRCSVPMMLRICSSVNSAGYCSGSAISADWPREIMSGTSRNNCETCCDSSGTRPNSVAASSTMNPMITVDTASSRGMPQRSIDWTMPSSRYASTTATRNGAIRSPTVKTAVNPAISRIARITACGSEKLR